MNRLDKVVVFHALQQHQLEEILQIELSRLQQRVLETEKRQFLFHVTDAGRQFLLHEGRISAMARAPEAGHRAARGLPAG